MNIEDKCRKIKLIITDVDGVMTNGHLYYNSEGEETKQFNVKDGLICILLRKYFKLGVITGRKSAIVAKRFEELKFDYVYQGQRDKRMALDEILEKEELSEENVAYIGDDLNDLVLLMRVGLSATPANAPTYIKNEVDLVCKAKGGEGAFREFAELILARNELLLPQIEKLKKSWTE